MSKGSSYWSTATGKIGNTVVSINKGQRIERAYQPNVTNPKTNAQMTQRALFASQVKFYKAATANFFQFAFEDKKQTESYYNAFMRNNRGVGIITTLESYKNRCFPALGNRWMLTKGSLTEFEIYKFGGQTEIPGGIVINDIDTDVENATIAQVSSALISKYDLVEGDIITFVYIETEVTSIEDEPTSLPKWNVYQFILSTSDNRSFTDAGFPTAVSMTKQTESDSAWISFQGSGSEGAHGSAVMATRKTANGLLANDSYVYLNDELYEVYQASLQDTYRAKALASWGATGEAILEGSLVQ